MRGFIFGILVGAIGAIAGLHYTDQAHIDKIHELAGIESEAADDGAMTDDADMDADDGAMMDADDDADMDAGDDADMDAGDDADMDADDGDTDDDAADDGGDEAASDDG